jgi:membrane-associated protein
MHWFYHIVQYALAHYGYWAVLAALLAEDAGVPVPGETTLMFASFVAHKGPELKLVWVIVIGIGAAVMGDNIGFFLGRALGRHLIRFMKKVFRLDDEDIGAARYLIQRHGASTIFWARFIFGLRTVAGPMAGVLGMKWKRFLTFNALGAAVWVTTMALTGYAFANEFNSLLDYFEKASWAIAAGLFTLAYLIWRREKKKYKERQHHRPPKAA